MRRVFHLVLLLCLSIPDCVLDRVSCSVCIKPDALLLLRRFWHTKQMFIVFHKFYCCWTLFPNPDISYFCNECGSRERCIVRELYSLWEFRCACRSYETKSLVLNQKFGQRRATINLIYLLELATGLKYVLSRLTLLSIFMLANYKILTHGEIWLIWKIIFWPNTHNIYSKIQPRV